MNSERCNKAVMVSVLVPTYNRAQMLRKAIESVLAQSWGYFEIVVCDNHSEDETAEVIAELSKNDGRIRYYRNEKNIGAVANWAKAFSYAQGKYAVILSDDDYFLDPNYLENGLDLLEKYNSGLLITNCVYGKATESVSSLELSEFVSGMDYFMNFWRGSYQVPVISNIFSVELAKKCGLFYDSAVLYSDIEFWLKLFLLTDVVYYRYPAVYYNFHGTNTITTMSIESHCTNVRFINNVEVFAQSKLDKNNLYMWKVNMYRHYLNHLYKMKKLNYSAVVKMARIINVRLMDVVSIRLLRRILKIKFSS